MNKIIFVFIMGAILLSGCQGATVSSAKELAPAELVQTSVVTPTVIESVTSGPEPEMVLVSIVLPTSTPTPEITATPQPFLCPYLYGETEPVEFTSQAMDEKVRYLVHLPPCYDEYPDRAFPVLYLLHGWPMDESHWDKLGVDELADDWISRGVVGPFIVVLPGVSADGRYVHSSGGDSSFEGMLVNELVPAVDLRYRTIQKSGARAIGGISRGGVWSLEIALRHADVFGILGAHSPALALNNPAPQYDPFLLVKDSVPDLRIYLDGGDADWARASASKLRDVLVEKDVEVTYQVHKGGHIDDLWSGALGDYLVFYTATWPKSFDSLPQWSVLTEVVP